MQDLLTQAPKMITVCTVADFAEFTLRPLRKGVAPDAPLDNGNPVVRRVRKATGL